MGEWTELKDLQAVADAQVAGWEIQFLDDWNKWLDWAGEGWDSTTKYVGRPAQPKKVVVTSECWRNRVYGTLHWIDPSRETPRTDWQRFPAGDLTGEVEDV